MPPGTTSAMLVVSEMALPGAGAGAGAVPRAGAIPGAGVGTPSI